MTSLQEKYFEILNNIRLEKEELKDVDSTKIDSIITKANNLFNDVSNPVELKLDARISAETVNLSSVDFEKRLRNRKITTSKFINQLNRCFDERVNGSDEQRNHTKKLENFFVELRKKFFGIKFTEIYTLGEEKKFKKREGRKKDEDDNEKTTINKCQMKDDTFINKIEKIVEKIGDQKIDYYKAVLDPNSFTKTIENIFALSFAVKLQKLSLVFDEDFLFVIKGAVGQISDENTEIRHFASIIDHEEYKTLLNLLKIEKPFLDF